LGGAEVKLLIPVARESAGETEGMGIAPAAVEELAISPALVRSSRDGEGVELVVGAETLKAALGSNGTTPPCCFATRTGHPGDLVLGEARIRVNERVMRVAAVRAEYFAGVEYLYRIRLED
jgi:hypothetical protein